MTFFSYDLTRTMLAMQLGRVLRKLSEAPKGSGGQRLSNQNDIFSYVLEDVSFTHAGNSCFIFKYECNKLRNVLV